MEAPAQNNAAPEVLASSTAPVVNDSHSVYKIPEVGVEKFHAPVRHGKDKREAARRIVT